jgi:hypothetical protein
VASTDATTVNVHASEHRAATLNPRASTRARASRRETAVNCGGDRSGRGALPTSGPGPGVGAAVGTAVAVAATVGVGVTVAVGVGVTVGVAVGV